MSVLLLNTTHEPLRILSLKRAICLVLDGKADVLEESEVPFRSESLSMGVPKVIKLRYFVQIPFRAKIPLNRRTLMARDKHKCQFNDCTRVGNTIDHVKPRSRGGQHHWDNVVAACGPCNQVKGDRLLSSLGWTLKNVPVAPIGTRWLVLGIAPALEAEWAPYLEYA